MERKFSTLLDEYLQEAGLSLRRAALQSGIPHQTLFNWLKGRQPRWHPALPGDLSRLGSALGLNDDQAGILLRLAGCIPPRPGSLKPQEVQMESVFRIPKGWFDTGESMGTYVMGVDPNVRCGDRLSITIKALDEPTEFGALAQEIKAEVYRGKRLRYSATVRSAGVENRAALFMRVGGVDGKLLAFDNMRERFIHGDADWTSHSIVLDVAADAETILFGILLSQQGQVWMADVRLEEVGRDVPTTDIVAEIIAYFPVNLGFEE